MRLAMLMKDALQQSQGWKYQFHLAEVDLCIDKGEYFLQAGLNISIPGLARELAQELIDESHRTCPYSKAIEGNMDVEYNLVNITV